MISDGGGGREGPKQQRKAANMRLGRFHKSTRKNGTKKSSGTIKAQNLLRKMDKKDGTKKIQSTQENVDDTSKYDTGGREDP